MDSNQIRLGIAKRDLARTAREGPPSTSAVPESPLDSEESSEFTSSSEEDEDGDDDAPARLLEGHLVYLKGTSLKTRRKKLVESLGGRVIDSIQGANAEVPTLAILSNHHGERCEGKLSHLLPRHRVVRERWLLRLEGLTELPDFRPDVVYARVGDVRDSGSYFYRAVPDADLVRRRDDDWKAIPEDWTPSA